MFSTPCAVFGVQTESNFRRVSIPSNEKHAKWAKNHYPQEDTQEDSASNKCKDKAEALKNDMMGLEFFLQDKKDYKTYCPYDKWKQPALVTYKKEPKSYLPKGCKAEKI